jgi:hypothetical protein
MTVIRLRPVHIISAAYDVPTSLATTHNLWQVQGVIADGVKDKVLELVHRPQQVISEGSHRN